MLLRFGSLRHESEDERILLMLVCMLNALSSVRTLSNNIEAAIMCVNVCVRIHGDLLFVRS